MNTREALDAIDDYLRRAPALLIGDEAKRLDGMVTLLWGLDPQAQAEVAEALGVEAPGRGQIGLMVALRRWLADARWARLHPVPLPEKG